MNKMKDLLNILLSKNKILMISHIKPDGDSIGSLLGFGLALMKKIDNIDLAILDNIPNKFSFLYGIELVRNKINIEEYDCIIFLDCGDENRIGIQIDLDKYFVINIDHHISNTEYGNINIVNHEASSTGEIIFKLIKELNIELDLDIATSLYVAISTDTGSFMYDNTTSFTHLVVSELLNYGLNINMITSNVYQNRSLQKTKLFIESLKRLELYEDNKIALVTITEEMIKSCKASSEDLDGIIEFIRDIESVEVSVLLREITKFSTRIGLRSKKYVDVSKIAKKYNGGGHIRASGCTFNGDVNTAKEIILREITSKIR